MTAHPQRKPPTPADINRQQGFDPPKSKTEAASSAIVAKTAVPATATQPAVPATTAAAPVPALPDTRTPEEAFFDEGSPSAMFDGRLFKYDNKVPRYFTIDDDTAIPDGTILVAQCDQLVWGQVKFNGPGNPPDRHLGLKYDGYVPPARDALGDNDPRQWEIGLSGKPDDPWQIYYYLPVENPETHEVFCFTASTDTTRRAVGKLLRHYDRVQKTDTDFYPLIQLKHGGFTHRNSRVGWVNTPVLAVVGRIPRADAAKLDGGQSGLPNDTIPF